MGVILANESKSEVVAYIDECIERYLSERRKRIDSFIDNHFTLGETVKIQKKTLAVDILLNPLNAFWSIPYLSLKKVSETVDKFGWQKLNSGIDKLPSGIKTRYRVEIENLIADEVLNSSDSFEGGCSFSEELRKHPKLKHILSADQMTSIERAVQSEFKKELDRYSASQAFISDLATSVLTLVCGWLVFGDRTLNVFGLGDRIAGKMAHDRAVSDFFLGEGLGTAYYSLFPPKPTSAQVVLITLGIGILFTALSLALSAFSDPLRKMLGLHRAKLNGLLDNLEEQLFVRIKKSLKQSIQNKSGGHTQEAASTREAS